MTNAEIYKQQQRKNSFERIAKMDRDLKAKPGRPRGHEITKKELKEITFEFGSLDFAMGCK